MVSTALGCRVSNDAAAAVSHIARIAPDLGGDGSRLAVGGESAGANLAAGLALLSRDGRIPAIGYQLLLCPWVEAADFGAESYRLFGEGVWLSRRSMEYYREQYLGAEGLGAGLAADPRVSPARAGSLAGLAPAHVVTAEFDVLRDEGEAYAARLGAAGVPTSLARYSGMIHSFFVLTGVLDEAGRALADCGARLKRAFV